MRDDTDSRVLTGFPTAVLCNAHSAVRAMHYSLSPLFEGTSISGPAKTALITPGQNAAIHRAIASARQGEVLVVAGGDGAFGSFGEILAVCCLQRGVSGLVIDGAIRDTAEVRDMGFAVFAQGANPTPTAKSGTGAIDVEVECAGVRVRPGDIIVGDDDGVVVVPKEVVGTVTEEAGKVLQRESAIRARVEDGESSCVIFGIES